VFRSYFDGRLIAPGGDGSMVGASPALLRQLGYRVTRVPSVDARIDRCLPQVGYDGTRCWARLDQYLMERVVPWVPVLFPTTTRALSGRVVSFSFDQLTNHPALDRISLGR
jgi:hypothetical protein